MCADRREYNAVRGATDNQTKLFKVSPTAMFALSGNRGILRRGDLGKLYDVPDVVSAYFKRHSDKTVEQNWEGLKRELGNSYVEHLAGGGPAWNPAPTFDGWLYLITFIFNNPDKSVQTKRMGAKLSNSMISITDANAAVGTMLGQTDVIAELQSGNNPAFNELRDNSLLKAFFTGAKNGSNTSLEDAIEFAKILVQATSRRYLELKPNGIALVSENYDCAVVGRNGFVWLRQNAK
jgi:hypothetical protein